MLVLHFITSLHDGGAQRSLSKLVEKSHFKHVVINLSEEGKYSSKLARYCEVINLSCKWYSLPSSMMRALVIALRLKPSILSSWLYHADAFAWVISCVLKIPVIWNIRNNSITQSKLSTRLLVLINAKLSAYVSFITFNSSFSEATHKSLGYSPKESTVVHNGFNIKEKLPVGTQISTSDPQIGFAARWDPVKNHRKLLKAFMNFNKKYPKSRLHLAGLGMNLENVALNKILSNYSISNCVILYDSIDDIKGFYRRLSIHILPSLSEAFPNTLYESVLCGIPNIYSNTIDSNITPPGITPFEPDSSTSIYESLKHFHDLPITKKLQILTDQQTFIKSSFPMDKFVETFDSIFKEVSCD